MRQIDLDEHGTTPEVPLSRVELDALQKDLERRQARNAAAKFRAFLDAHPEEQAWLADWDGADLAAPPARGPEA